MRTRVAEPGGFIWDEQVTQALGGDTCTFLDPAGQVLVQVF